MKTAQGAVKPPPLSAPIILGIESSCDETAGAIVQGGREVMAQFVASQLDLHRRFGGVVPEIACRAHMEAMLPGLQTIFADSGITPRSLDAIAVTNRPGLIGALLVGVSAAKALALAWDKPLIGVDHIEAHIAAGSMIEPEMSYPFVALVVSGGHTNVFHVTGPGTYDCLHQTLDDAAGEAFDKVAKILGLGFPGGPAIEQAARTGNPRAYPWRNTCLPKGENNFSFSGIKTAVLYTARGQNQGRKAPLRLTPGEVADAAASFQRAAVHALVTRTIASARQFNVKWIALGGGVAANSLLRREMTDAAGKIGCKIAIPPMALCTDNAVMVAARGHELLQAGKVDDLDLETCARRDPAQIRRMKHE